MSRRLTGDPHYRTTDHSNEIARMRDHAENIVSAYPDAMTCPPSKHNDVRILQASADLLEVHDATGISLDDWRGPRKLVETALLMIGASRDDFLPNGV